MNYFLSRESRPIIKQLAVERTLCAFDFDGTLSPIVDHPDQAGMRNRTRDLLRRLAVLYPCIVVSGRGRADVLEKLGGATLARVLGNHGAESETSLVPRKRIDQWKAILESELHLLPGIWVEDKGFSLAVHFRQSIHKAESRRQILTATERLEHANVFGGKKAVNLVPIGAPHKGDALAAEQDRLKCTSVLYLGDDENDEDAFALDGNIVPVRIGRTRHSHARFFLRTQMEIDELLELLVRLREPIASV
jgi:trehalose 6-phosphate phosphatase